MKKYLFYILGVFLVAIGVSLVFFVGTGSSPYDTFTGNLAMILNIDVGVAIIIMNSILALIYYNKHKNKDIIITYLVNIIFGSLVSLCISLFGFFLYDLSLTIIQKSMLFIGAFLIYCLGITLIEKTSVSMMALECFVKFCNETILKKVSEPIARIIVEVSFLIVGCILSFIAVGHFGHLGITTIVFMLLTGPIVSLFSKVIPNLSK